MKTIRDLLGNKTIRMYLTADIILLILLLCEFITFQYGVLKIIKYIILIETLFIVAWKDQRDKVIPNKYLLVMLCIRALLLICEWFAYPTYGLGILSGSFMGMLIGFITFGACYLFSHGGMGAGDVKLITVLGFYLGGSTIVPTMILIVLSSAVFSIVKLIRKKTTMKTEIPFAPFVLMGTILAMMVGV